jgi:hypothetical protein
VSDVIHVTMLKVLMPALTEWLTVNHFELVAMGKNTYIVVPDEFRYGEHLRQATPGAEVAGGDGESRIGGCS